MTIPENRDGACVVPIVDDVLEDVRVAATSHLQKKISADCFAAFPHADRLDALLRSVGHMGHVEKDSPQTGMRLQDGLKEYPVSAAHIDNGAELRKVIRGGNSDGDSLGKIRHSRVEVRGLVWVPAPVVTGIRGK